MPRLPRSPDVAVMGLTAALEGAANGGITLFDLVDKVERETRTERARAEGLAGWLPLSRVAAWDTDGQLVVDQVTDVYDLALRYAAWVASQPTPAEFAEASRSYATRIGELALETMRSGRLKHRRGSGRGLPRAARARKPVPKAEAPQGSSITERIRALLRVLDGAF